MGGGGRSGGWRGPAVQADDAVQAQNTKLPLKLQISKSQRKIKVRKKEIGKAITLFLQ